jgi:hypothetical protein
MIKRKTVMKMVLEEERREKEQTAKIKEKLAGLRSAVTGLVAATPEDLWTLPELGRALKPSKIVCETVKKFQDEAKNEPEHCQGCRGCQDEEKECKPQCECETSPNLCDTCMNFLFQAVQFMAEEKEVDIFGMGNIMLIGIHVERTE